MVSFITVHYVTTGNTFQNRVSDSLLGLEEGHPHSPSFKESYIASKISKSWLGEKKCKMQIISNLKAVGVYIKPNKPCIKTVRPILM